MGLPPCLPYRPDIGTTTDVKITSDEQERSVRIMIVQKYRQKYRQGNRQGYQ